MHISNAESSLALSVPQPSQPHDISLWNLMILQVYYTPQSPANSQPLNNFLIKATGCTKSPSFPNSNVHLSQFSKISHFLLKYDEFVLPFYIFATILVLMGFLGKFRW